MQINKWTKKLDEMHYYISDRTYRTLCGRAMLGNNYADYVPGREECKDCLKKIKGLEKKSVQIKKIVAGIEESFKEHQRLMNKLYELDELEAENVLAWEQEQG